MITDRKNMSKGCNKVGDDEERDFTLEDPGYINVVWDQRAIFVSGTINEKVATKFHSCILRLEGKSNDIPIKVFINSTGGFLNSCFYMIHIIRQCKCPVYTIAGSYALSAACMLLAAGTPGYRYAFPDALLMLHELTSSFTGTASEFEMAEQDIKESMDKIVNLIHSTTGKQKAKIKKDLEDDLYLTAQEAIKYGSKGLIDAIWE